MDPAASADTPEPRTVDITVTTSAAVSNQTQNAAAAAASGTETGSTSTAAPPPGPEHTSTQTQTQAQAQAQSESSAHPHPWLKFPPFPAAPPDLIPFNDFKPAGIVIRENATPNADADADANATDDSTPPVEVDGLGIPTVTLLVHHDRDMKRKRKGGKVRVTADGTIVHQVWYEAWAENEPARGLTAPIDSSLPRIDRLHQAVYEFKHGRPLQQNVELAQIWDRFRVYTGLLGTMHTPGKRKDLSALQPQEGDEEDEEGDEMPNARPPKERKIDLVQSDGPISGPSNAAQSASVWTPEQRQQRNMYYSEVRDTKKDNFLNDPEKATKIFFSGYYRDRGLMYSEKSCRDGPILLRFFLNFLLRTRVFPEMEKDLRKAVAVTELAQRELLQAFVIGARIPDAFSKGCALLFGTMAQTMVWTADAEAAILQPAAGSEKIEVITPEAVASMEQDSLAAADADANDGAGQEENVPEGEGEQQNLENENGNAEWGADWGAPTADQEWSAPQGNDWGQGPQENPLAKYLGPTTLPLTHTTGIVERSTRRIKSITMPPAPSPPAPQKGDRQQPAEAGAGAPLHDPEAVERVLESTFAKLTLVPWHEWDLYQSADVRKPLITAHSRGSAVTDDCEGAPVTPGPGPAHNPFKDEITVYVEPGTAEVMLPGMGIQALWIQLARVDPGVPIEVDLERFNNSWSSNKTEVGGPGEPVAPTKIWYMEEVLAVHPSFHTEMVPLPTKEDLFGEEAL